MFNIINLKYCKRDVISPTPRLSRGIAIIKACRSEKSHVSCICVAVIVDKINLNFRIFLEKPFNFRGNEGHCKWLYMLNQRTVNSKLFFWFI